MREYLITGGAYPLEQQAVLPPPSTNAEEDEQHVIIPPPSTTAENDEQQVIIPPFPTATEEGNHRKILRRLTGMVHGSAASAGKTGQA